MTIGATGILDDITGSFGEETGNCTSRALVAGSKPGVTARFLNRLPVSAPFYLSRLTLGRGSDLGADLAKEAP